MRKWIKFMKKQQSRELSIIILSRNTRNLTKQCLNSLKKYQNEADFEVIVSDNGSTDGTLETIKSKYDWVKIIENGTNLGFAAGNNRARKLVSAKFILFLNSDTIVKKGAVIKTLEYLRSHSDVGAITCKVVLPNGKLDKDTRRSFPTPWVSFSHLVLKADRLFPKSRLFAQYWYGFIPENSIHEVDVIQGAFLMTRKKLLDKIDWFDESYFLDGEDIDICWRIKEEGLKRIYYPKAKIVHIKGATKGKQDAKRKVPLKERIKFRMSSVSAMEIFYKKHLRSQYPFLINVLVLFAIKTLRLLRLIKVLIS